jgi:hypothetical protein
LVRNGSKADVGSAPPAGSWLAQMLARKPKMLVIVALANIASPDVAHWKTLRVVASLSVSSLGVIETPPWRFPHAAVQAL